MVTLDIHGSLLRCRYKDEVRWTLDPASIVLIAEYTTSAGPQIDDYFIIFVGGEKGEALFCECTFYAEGRDRAIQMLQEQFGIVATFRLCSSIEWNSRVMWPIQMAGQDYFSLSEVAPGGLSSKIYKAIFGPQLEYKITEPVQSYITRVTAGRIT